MPDTTARPHRHSLRFWIFLAVLAACAVAVFLSPLGAELTPERLDHHFASLRGTAWAAPAYALLVLLGVWALVPATVFLVAGGLLFDPVTAFLSCGIGINAGAFLAFASARGFLRHFAAQLAGKSRWFPALDRMARANGLFLVFVCRIAVVVPWNVLNYVAGCTAIRKRHYAAGTALGILPALVIYPMFGVAARKAGSDPWTMAIPIGAAVVLVSVALLLRKRFLKPQAEDEAPDSQRP